MKVYRYMSREEFTKLINGTSLHNPTVRDTDYSTSCGFCFLAETTTFVTFNFDGEEQTFEYTPEDCSSFLGGIVTEEVLVEFEVMDPQLLRSDFATYMNPISTEYEETIYITEYSCHTYDRTVLRPLRYKLCKPNGYTYWDRMPWIQVSDV